MKTSLSLLGIHENNRLRVRTIPYEFFSPVFWLNQPTNPNRMKVLTYKTRMRLVNPSTHGYYTIPSNLSLVQKTPNLWNTNSRNNLYRFVYAVNCRPIYLDLRSRLMFHVLLLTLDVVYLWCITNLGPLCRHLKSSTSSYIRFPDP